MSKRKKSRAETIHFLQTYVDRGYGIIAGPDGLGIWIGTDINACPPGWMFLDAFNFTYEVLEEMYELLLEGRSCWPKKDK